MKSSLLFRLTGPTPLAELTPAELTSRRSAAEAELGEAEHLHRKAALACEQGLSGAIGQKAEAAGVLRLAQERLRDVMAAQIEAEGERAERHRPKRRQQFARAGALPAIST